MVVNLSWCRFLLVFQEGSNYGSSRIARGPIMEIDNVRREDAGTYMCTASNNVGTMSADEIDLRVLCKFFFSGMPLQQKTKELRRKSFLQRYFIDHNLLLRRLTVWAVGTLASPFLRRLTWSPFSPFHFPMSFFAKAMKVKAANEKWPFLLLSWFYGFHREKALSWLTFGVWIHTFLCVSQKSEKEAFFLLSTEFAQEYVRIWIWNHVSYISFFRFFDSIAEKCSCQQWLKWPW